MFLLNLLIFNLEENKLRLRGKLDGRADDVFNNRTLAIEGCKKCRKIKLPVKVIKRAMRGCNTES